MQLELLQFIEGVMPPATIIIKLWLNKYERQGVLVKALDAGG